MRSIRMPRAIATRNPPRKSVPSEIQVGIESMGPQAIRAPRTIRARPPLSAPTGANLASGDAVMDQTVADPMADECLAQATVAGMLRPDPVTHVGAAQAAR